jgi:hypothetical protein
MSNLLSQNSKERKQSPLSATVVLRSGSAAILTGQGDDVPILGTRMPKLGTFACPRGIRRAGGSP